ncbi:hypothetical protein Vadar_018098 [Vaccinium darrowii]|uniref:Uncharacterized protein n=1 Tax=Vaccinium darrowii TaxID=229202 RepID=A0ACB7YWT0_9ERIC|nr:hypothetical protein Vadar_018098 [Vaccinium darrowii]
MDKAIGTWKLMQSVLFPQLGPIAARVDAWNTNQRESERYPVSGGRGSGSNSGGRWGIDLGFSGGGGVVVFWWWRLGFSGGGEGLTGCGRVRLWWCGGSSGGAVVVWGFGGAVVKVRVFWWWWLGFFGGGEGLTGCGRVGLWWCGGSSGGAVISGGAVVRVRVF